MDEIDEYQIEQAINTIRRLGTRRFVVDLATALGHASAAIRARGKGTKAKVVANFDLVNVGDRMVVINETVKETLPASESRGAAFYEKDGKLFDRDPDAPEFFYRVIEGETGEVRDVPVTNPTPREV